MRTGRGHARQCRTGDTARTGVVGLAIVEILCDVRMEILERRAEDPEGAVLVVATDLRIVGFEMTPVARREVVFRVDAVNICALVEMFVGAETVVDHDGFAEFLGGHAVDGVSPRFVFADRAAGNESLAFRGVVRAFAEEDAAVVVDHQIDRDERDRAASADHRRGARRDGCRGAIRNGPGPHRSSRRRP